MTADMQAPEDAQRIIAELRQRVADLEQQVAGVDRLRDELGRYKNEALASQAMLQLIIDNLPGSVFWKDTNLFYRGCNRSFAANAGVGEPQHIVGKSDYDLAWKREEAEFFRQVDRRVMDSNTAEYHIIEPQQQADGKHAWLDTNKIPLHDSQGNVIGILGTFEDITERKQIEDALRHSEDRFRTLVESIAVAAWIHQEGRFIYVNPATEALLGYTRAELLGLKVWDVIHPDFQETVRQRAIARQRGDNPESRYEIKVLSKDGQELWVDLNASRIEFEGQQSILVTFLDITARKQMEETLRASEERFRTLIETFTIGTLIHQQGAFRYANRATEQITGYSRDEIYQLGFADLIHPDFVELVRQRATARMQGESVPTRYEIKIINKQGQERWVDLNNNRIEFGGEPCILVTVLDITERKQIEENLRASEEQLRTLVETNAVATWIHQGQNFLYVNPATEQLSGYTRQELQQMYVWDLIHPDFREMVKQRAIARQQGAELEPRYEVKIVVKDGGERWVDLNARRIEMQGQPAIMATALDITERKEMEEERIRLQAETIQAQQAMLRELSTPLIPITDHVVVMPLVGRIDSGRAQQVMEGLLQGVAQHGAQTVILDITGVPVVDTQVALALIQAAQAVRLLGARVVLTGIRPDVAQSLVSLEIDMSDLVTLSSLQTGIAYATR